MKCLGFQLETKKETKVIIRLYKLARYDHIQLIK